MKEEDRASEACVELVVVAVDLDKHKGLSADDTGDDVNHQRKCV